MNARPQGLRPLVLSEAASRSVEERINLPPKFFIPQRNKRIRTQNMRQNPKMCMIQATEAKKTKISAL